MLLAAGRGERLRPLTDTLPKPLVEVQGRSLIERHLDALACAGIDRVVINMGWLGEQLAERIGSGERYGLSVAFTDERDGILETAGGIRNALPLLGRAPFLVVNADVFTDMPLPCPLPGDSEMAHLVLVPKPAFKAAGDFDVADGRLRNADSPAYTFSGVATYRPEFFADLEPGRRPLAPLLREAADAGRVGASVYTGTWEDVGTAKRLAALNNA